SVITTVTFATTAATAGERGDTHTDRNGSGAWKGARSISDAENPGVLIPVLELPGSELPGCQRLYAPLPPAVRRPVTETRCFLDLGLANGPHDPAAPCLA